MRPQVARRLGSKVISERDQRWFLHRGGSTRRNQYAGLPNCPELLQPRHGSRPAGCATPVMVFGRMRIQCGLAPGPQAQARGPAAARRRRVPRAVPELTPLDVPCFQERTLRARGQPERGRFKPPLSRGPLRDRKTPRERRTLRSTQPGCPRAHRARQPAASATRRRPGTPSRSRGPSQTASGERGRPTPTRVRGLC
jgi:hypothetical protein